MVVTTRKRLVGWLRRRLIAAAERLDHWLDDETECGACGDWSKGDFCENCSEPGKFSPTEETDGQKDD